MHRLFLLSALCAPAYLLAQEEEIPVSGQEVAELAQFDEFARDLLNKSGGPGVSLAVVRDGRLVFARGYGYSRVETKEPVLPTTLFRANSVSKWITNAAVQELIKDGVLSEDDGAFSRWLPETLPAEPDPRLNEIKLWHLFAHGVPWKDDRRCRFDLAASVLKAPVPTPPQLMLHFFTRNEPLNGVVGEKYQYHNTNHVILARVIERAVGMGYEEFVQKRMLEPLGIRRMRIGNTRRADLSAHESFVYLLPDDPLGSNALPQDSVAQPASHQLCTNEMQDANGGWLASAPDVALLASRYEVSDYRVTSPGRYTLYLGAHTGGGIGGWGLSIAVSKGPGNGMALFLNGADGTTQWAKDRDPLLWWIVAELRRLFDETPAWPEHDLRPAIDEDLTAALTADTGAESLQWTVDASGSGADVQSLEINAGEEEAWHIVSSALWLDFSPREGKGPATIELRPNRNGLWPGQYYGTLAIENASRHSNHKTIPLALTVEGEEQPPALAISQALVPMLDPDQELNVQFKAAGGTPPYEWQVLEELPAGFSFAAEEARLTGKSKQPGATEITVRVSDAAGATAIRRWMLAVNQPTVLPWRRVGLTLTNAFNSQAPCTSPAIEKVPATQQNVTAVVSYLGGVKYGDELIFEWLSPDGVLRSRMRYNLLYDLVGAGTAPRCQGSGLLPVAGNANATRTGEWKVRVLYNRNLAAERKFLLE